MAGEGHTRKSMFIKSRLASVIQEARELDGSLAYVIVSSWSRGDDWSAMTNS